MAGITLDAGALIAADRNDERFWGFFRESVGRGVTTTIPAGALAQAWRGPRSARLAQLLEACEVHPMDEGIAKAAGELCGVTRTADVIDASVVIVAAARGEDVLTTDPEDLRALARSVGRVRILDLRLVG